MVDTTALFGVIGVAFAITLVTELLQYFLIYNTSSFRALKANVEKSASKVEAARDASTSNSKSLKKNQARLTSWEEEAGKQLAAVNMKAGAIVSQFSTESFHLSKSSVSLKYNCSLPNQLIFLITASPQSQI